jgi:cytochrome P450
MPNWIIDLDPPDHTRLRKLLLVAFNRRVVESIRPFVQQRVQTLMDKLEAQPTIEFNEQIARQLPGSVILKLLGLPPENIERLRAWSNAFMEAVAVPGVSHQALQAFEDAMAEMNAIFTVEIEKRRTHPTEDLLTELVRANEAGDRLSLDEMLGALHVLVVAGHDTTSNTMTMGLGTLIQHPDAWDALYRNPDRILESVMELMRHMSMATSQPRFATQDFEWAGQPIKRGQLIFLMLASGNRDPRAFDDPLRLDLTRSNERSLTFAPGLHYCIGHLLAKMQVCEFFLALTKRFSGAELLDPKWDFMPQIAFRGLYQLNVRMQKR